MDSGRVVIPFARSVREIPGSEPKCRIRSDLMILALVFTHRMGTTTFRCRSEP
jgi:hypothetical protein